MSSQEDKPEIVMAVDEKRNGEKGTIPMPATTAEPAARRRRFTKFDIILVVFSLLLVSILGHKLLRGYVHSQLTVELEHNADDLDWALQLFGSEDELSDFIFDWDQEFVEINEELDEIATELAKPGFGEPPHKKPRRTPRRPLNGKPAEHVILHVPNNVSAIKASHRLASRPHMAGTPGDLDTAMVTLKALQYHLGIPITPFDPVYSAGSWRSRLATLSIPVASKPTAWIDVYYPVMNTPLNRSVDILDEGGKSVWSADLVEKADEQDPDAFKYADAVPTFHGLSLGGDVEGKLVYANYGRKEDYDELVEKGVNLTGTIVIVRYGGIFRGLKVKGAQERGAVGCLIYSDPRDDGSVTAKNGYDYYPNGPARNPTSVQRGSVQFISAYPGDPTTPGYPSYENSTRSEASNIPSIPSLPLSWANAEVLLKEIEEDGKNRTIKFINQVDTKVTPIWNVMAVIPGHIKDEVVVVGNHRDAWVLGAADPTSGSASTYEVVRGLGVLSRLGWKPLRTIVLASWDAEEYGLIGSTEWGEDFPKFLQKHVVAYLNLDGSVSGSRFGLSASPLLANLVRQAAIDVPHPTKANKTLWDAKNDRGELFGEVDKEVQAMYDAQFGPSLEKDVDILTTQGKKLRTAGTGVSTLGSGSDFTVFLQHLGIASASLGFGSTLSDPVYHYHSIFDSQTWQLKYGDPGFLRHIAVSKSLGLQLLRLADTLVLPLNTTQYALELDAYLDKVESIKTSLDFKADFSDLRESISSLQEASLSLDKEKEEAPKKLKKLVKKWFKKHSRRRRRHVYAHGHGSWLRISSFKIKCIMKGFGRRVANVFGVNQNNVPTFGCKCPGGDRKMYGADINQDEAMPAMPAADSVEPPHGPPHHPLPHPPRPPHGPPHRPRFPHLPGDAKLLREIIKAVKRVRTVNAKLASFERGFISKEGISDREWYKHLGVAPGKWLGYGATTFPALTEALTIEKNETLAQYEAARLKELFVTLAKKIDV